jgi:glycosyltransferase involved in cell wall biosynthesis
MLAILTTHPIQYQVPFWQALARDGRVPFEVWYLTDHATRPSLDVEFGKTFRWDIETLAGYPHRTIDAADGATPDTFWKCRLRERLRDRLHRSAATALWVQGWQVAAYWQAVHEARAVGVEVWLRGESNDLSRTEWWKRPLKRLALGRLFSQVDRFLYIGSANKRLYQRFGVPDAQLFAAPYAVDNERFARQAAALRPQRMEWRRRWGVGDDAFCVMFCGKFIAKKRPMDLVEAARLHGAHARRPDIHLLFVGAGELGGSLRGACDVVYDAERNDPQRGASFARPASVVGRPRASFVGFLNQTEISRAYVAADCLVLPSDEGETWGLVVNEALASGTTAIASKSCGCAEDMLPAGNGRRTFETGNTRELAEILGQVQDDLGLPAGVADILARHNVRTTASAVCSLYAQRAEGRRRAA